MPGNMWYVTTGRCDFGRSLESNLAADGLRRQSSPAVPAIGRVRVLLDHLGHRSKERPSKEQQPNNGKHDGRGLGTYFFSPSPDGKRHPIKPEGNNIPEKQ